MLTVSHINLKKGGKQIIDDVCFEVHDGEIFGILGANGAGKSSLALALMGSPEYLPDRGKIIFDGIDITRKSIDERARLGITLAWQEPARFEGLSVPDYVLLGAREHDPSQGERCLAQMRLAPSEYWHRQVDRTLSGGERKKIELAAVMAMQPRLAILDEPDSGIDMISQEAVINLIYEIRDYGGAVILISHEEEVVTVADRAALLCSGMAFKVGEPEEVVAYYRERCRPCANRNYPCAEDRK
jgi:Fe-S cluster assembly ATP-binding protein